MKAKLRATLEARLPALFALALDAKGRFFPNRGEPELRFVPILCHPDELALDIGANHGTYAAPMARHAGRLIAAEPNPHLARVLRRRLDAAIGAGRVTILEAAVSDSDGEIELFIPHGASALGSVEGHSTASGGGRGERVTVARRRIDGLGLPRTGFIKVDVEGHEASVIEGARGLIERDRPNILVEVEERHHPGSLDHIRAILGPFGYRGFFLLGGRLEPIEAFDAHVHQDRGALNPAGTHRLKGRVYVNNFIFSARAEVIDALRAPMARPPPR